MAEAQIVIGGRRIGLDARPDRLDIRDLPYRPRVAALPPQLPDAATLKHTVAACSRAGLILDQGEQGACTGFGLATVINYQAWIGKAENTHFERVSPYMLYRLARFYDEWQGEDYGGSSCRGALKGWHRHGVCVERLWPVPDQPPASGWDAEAVNRPLGVYYRIDTASVVDIQAAIHEAGAIYVSANVHRGWDLSVSRRKRVTHQALPVVGTGKVHGAHAFALVGYNAVGFVVQNSWGASWGLKGFAVLPYEDWIDHGTDAWAVAPGVPVSATGGRKIHSPRRFVESVPKITAVDGGTSWLGAGHDRLMQRRNVWDADNAYAHTLVTGNDGRVINRLPHMPDVEHSVADICCHRPARWLAQRKNHRKLIIYAHGGLNSENAAIVRNRILGPLILGNDIYPIFTAWRSGPVEILGGMLADHLGQLFRGRTPAGTGMLDYLSDATDRLLETACRHILVKAMWSEMKENIERSADEDRGLQLIGQQLARLGKSCADLEIHLVGHSAGAFVCGRLLTELRLAGMPVSSCTLFAPACSIAFANRSFRPAIESGTLARNRLHIHVLSEAREQADDVAAVYRKSMLYLASRALEAWHKTPLLGLATAYDTKRADRRHWHEETLGNLASWQAFIGAGNKRVAGLHVLDDDQVEVVKAKKSVQSAHACFDNSIRIMAQMLRRVRGTKLKLPVTNLDY